MRTKKGTRYAHFIDKEINLKGYRCGVTDIHELNHYLALHQLAPEETVIHARTASPYKIYETFKALEAKGFKVVNNPETIRLTSEKFNSCVYALKQGLPCAETLKVEKENAEPLIREKLSEWGSVVVKPITSQGQGEYCFRLEEENLYDYQNITTPEIILQQCIRYTRLNRVIVIGFKALKEVVFYDEPRDGWKCTVCLNPNILLDKNPSQELLALAEETARKFNSDVAFIDIFTTAEGYVLNEINTACSLVNHERMSGVNISERIAAHLVSL